MRYIISILFLLITFNTIAQQRIKGKVTDEHDLPLPGTTITLKHTTDGKIRSHAISDSLGAFEFRNIHAGSYHIGVAFITYGSQTRQITIGDGPVEILLFKLLPSTQQLQEVTIKGKKQAITLSAGNATMNVEQSSLAQSQSAYDLLKSLPGVNVNKDGEVLIKGKSGVTVMIDGEPVEISGAQLKNLLKGTPGTTLQSIQVMNNPPANMDAAGTGGVINLVFKKKIKKGVNGTISSNVSKGYYYKTNQSLNMTYGTQKWNLNLLYSFDFEHNHNRDSMFRSQNLDNTPAGQTDKQFSMNQLQLNPEKSNAHLAKIGIDHYFDDKNSLNLNLSFNDMRNPTDGRTVTRFSTGMVQDSLLNQRNILLNTLRNLDYGLKFKHTFSDLKYLTAAAQFNNLKSNGSEDYTILKTFNSGTTPSELRYRNSYPSRIDRKIFRVDYVQELTRGEKKSGRFEAGLKSSFTNLNNSQFSENRVDQLWQPVPERANDFQYKEAIHAAYADMNIAREPWTFNAGFRLEHTNISGKGQGNANTVHQNYLSLFPNALIGYKVSDNYNLSLTYNRRIERPDYDKLNPAVRYLDLYTTQQGNPQLKAQFSNNIELNQQFLSFIDLTLGYSSIKDPIYSTYVSSPGASSSQTNINTGHQQQWQASLSFPVPGIDWWENNQSFYFFTSQFNDNLENKNLKEQASSFGVFSYNAFKLPANFSLELSVWYQSGGLYSNFRFKPMSEVNFGINKKILNDKINIGVSLSDALYGGVFKGDVLSNNAQVFKMDSRTDSRQIKLNVSFNFGRKPKAETPANESLESDRLPSGKGQQIEKPAKL
ncbi:outer membrane beta-barrel protein [Chitinophaga sancti]|uniref:outer membrane beta-barrel protein n=1 Tax=Chitinophaga sancti TaxID=1004 RepID=UPI003F79BB08